MVSGGIVMALAANFLAAPLARLFVGFDRGLFELTRRAMKLYSISFLFAGLNIFTSSLFTALNNGLVSGIVSFLRALVLQIGMVLVLPGLIGENGLWLAAFATESCALVINICFLLGNRKKYGYF